MFQSIISREAGRQRLTNAFWKRSFIIHHVAFQRKYAQGKLTHLKSSHMNDEEGL
jgi:hypothetical protein